jgi:hypothetical protein
VSITGVCAFGEMAGVEVEHFAASFRISELAPSVEAEQNSRKLALWIGNFSEMKTGSAVHRRYTAESLVANLLISEPLKWWPGTESNRRRQPFQFVNKLYS